MAVNFGAKLWKIGSSMVFTLPASISKNLEDDYYAIDVDVNKNKFSLLKKPWRCGGSMVVTVPFEYVAGYDLRKGNIVEVNIKDI